MKKKIFGILICIILIAVSVFPVAGIIDDKKVINDDDNFFQQVVEKRILSSEDWLEQAKLLASDGASNDWFGRKVLISGDYAIITAPYDGDNGWRSGSAYVFKRDGTNWTEESKLLASDGANEDHFGWSLSMSGDYVIIGAAGDNNIGGDDSGSAYIFKRDGTNWTQQAKLLPSDGAPFDVFGTSVSISGDYAIIGAIYDDDNGGTSGSAYIFKRDGTNWTQQAKLLPSDGASGDAFGYVSISGDYAIIGAHSDDDNGDGSGSAYIFKRDGTTWPEQAKLLASDGAASDRFGNSVQFDGYYAIIGALFDDDSGSNSGSAYIFKRDGTTWTEQAKLLASDGAASDWFGLHVSISGDYVIIGAYGDDDSGSSSGSAYVFKKLNQPPYVPSNPDPFDGETCVDLDHNLSWIGGDPDPEDTVIYDVYFGTSNPPPLVSSGQEDEEYDPGTLNLEETYYWQIVSLDNHGNSTTGPIWSFTTRGNTEPEDPELDGPTEGAAGEKYTYEICSTDPDNDDVWYYIEWGDGQIEEWIGPYGSGDEVVMSHTWDDEGTYTIQAKAKDIFDAESDWGYLEVTMPVNQQNSHPSFHWFFERFPNAFPILRQIFGL